MKTNRFTAAFIASAAIFSASALAQTEVGGQAPTPNEVIYLPQLPTVADLTHSAAAQGETISSIQQRDGVEFATFRFSNGQTDTVAYRLLSAAGSGAAEANLTAIPEGTAEPAAAVAPNPAVVYATPTPAPDYNDYSYPGAYYPYSYYPWGWYPGISVGFGYGYGYRGGYGGYGYRGGVGFRGGSGFRGSAGFHGGGGGHR